MGTYLSTPVTEKGEESGETSELSWGVVDMQGWRKNMEDAHVAQTNVEVPPHLFAPDEDSCQDGKVFGVFDGHGGPEVARFCQLYIVSVLTQQPTWRGDVPTSVFENTGEYFKDDPANTPVGHALIQAFHAMDRLINDPLRRDEIIRLRAEKPMPGEHRMAMYVPSPYGDDFDGSTDGGYDSFHPAKDHHEDMLLKDPPLLNDDVSGGALQTAITEEVGAQSGLINEDQEHDKETTKTEPTTQTSGETAQESETNDAMVENHDGKAGTDEQNLTLAMITDDALSESRRVDLETGLSPLADTTEETFTKVLPVVESPTQHCEAKAEGEAREDKQKDEGGQDENDADASKDDDSNEAVGKEEAAELDQDMMDGSSETSATETNSLSTLDEVTPSNSPRGNVTVIFQKLMGITGQVNVNVVRDKGATDSDGEGDSSQRQNNSNQNAMVGTINRPSAATPTIIHNGRQICNLPDHPIHAGCTAVVAVMIGRTLTIANAGDSRAVLCRAGGRAEPLSFDHKPLQEREMRRITNAGGFVNQFGRVNGNLNLSRSIGDLKYKQVPGIHPAGQMITAEPDIVQVTLDPMDEFFILGCDGIWDCLTNEQAIAYVRERIDTKTPTQIGVEMLDEIISEDPRASQGIGGDNMTVMIVDLLPHTRSHRAKAS